MSVLHARCRSRAFTLIEILVVVAIIGLIIAVLLPSLARAREQGRAAVCSNNLRQLGIGWHMYAQQSGDAAVAGRFPTISGSNNLYWVGNGFKYRARWYAMLGAQVKMYAFSKPSPDPALDNTQPIDGEVYLDPSLPEWNNSRNYPYGYNFQFLGNSRRRIDGGQTDWIRWPVKTASIRFSGGTVVAADNLGTAATYPTAERLPYDRTGANTDPKRLGNHAWALDPPRLTAEGDFCDDNLRGQARSSVDPRHNGKANAIYTDGHMERRSPAELGYVVNSDGSVPLTGEGTNRLFSGTGRDDDPPAIRR